MNGLFEGLVQLAQGGSAAGMAQAPSRFEDPSEFDTFAAKAASELEDSESVAANRPSMAVEPLNPRRGEDVALESERGRSRKRTPASGPNPMPLDSSLNHVGAGGRDGGRNVVDQASANLGREIAKPVAPREPLPPPQTDSIGRIAAQEPLERAVEAGQPTGARFDGDQGKRQGLTSIVQPRDEGPTQRKEGDSESVAFPRDEQNARNSEERPSPSLSLSIGRIEVQVAPKPGASEPAQATTAKSSHRQITRASVRYSLSDYRASRRRS